MKSARARRSQTEPQAFWRWFAKISARLERSTHDAACIRELDRRVLRLDARLSWEIGPGQKKPWQLVISPNLNKELRRRAQKVIEAAPQLPNWEFYASRQPKQWNYQLRLGPEGISIDASSWVFLLLRYPDGTHEVLLTGPDLPPLSSDERWQAAALTLESILGEDMVLDKIGAFELVDAFEPQFAEAARPIQKLRSCITGNG